MVRWALLMRDGRIIRGAGPDVPVATGEKTRLKLSNLAADAAAAMFHHPDGRPMFAYGPVDLEWDVQHIVRGRRNSERRALSIRSLVDGARTFVMPDGSQGIGRTVEDVGKAYEAFARAEARARTKGR